MKGNMRQLIRWFFFFLVVFCGSAAEGQQSEIELVDGGVILGEIVSHSDGAYIVRSNSLGTLEIRESEIRHIRQSVDHTTEKALTAGTGNTVSPDMQRLQTSIMNNKEIMGLVLSLQSDPEMQALLSDPEIVAAVQSGDVAALMANPKFVKILNNAKVREIQQKLLTQEPGMK